MIARIWAWIKAWFVIVDPVFPPRPPLGHLVPKEERNGELHLTADAGALVEMLDADPAHRAWRAAVDAVPLPRWWRLRCWWRSRPVRPSALPLDAAFDAVPRVVDRNVVVRLRGVFSTTEREPSPPGPENAGRSRDVGGR